SYSIRADLAFRLGKYDEAARWLETCTAIMHSMPGIVPIDSPCFLPLAYAALGRADDARRALDEIWKMPDLARWHARPILATLGEALLAGDADAFDATLADAPDSMMLDSVSLRLVAADVLPNAPQRVAWLQATLATCDQLGMTIPGERV